MNRSRLILISALLAISSLGACDRAPVVVVPGPPVAGPAGPQGETGAQGMMGNEGMMGNQGEQGMQGNRGMQGYQGNEGTQGEAGKAGDATTVVVVPPAPAN
jgi:Collagen triple helix repeat (20 copies)